MKAILMSRLTWTCVLTTALYILLSPKWMVSYVAWIAPAGIILVASAFKPVKSLLLITLILFASGSVAMYNVLPFPTVLYVPMMIQISLFAAVPFFLYRILSPHVGGWISTFIFPCICTIWEYTTSFMGSGTWGSLAYTQMNSLELSQLSSITGMWGITFLVTWCSSLLVWTYQQRWNWSLIRTPALLFCLMMMISFVYGAIRTNSYFQYNGQSVRVAGITGFQLTPVITLYRDAFGQDLHVDLEKLNQSSPELEKINQALAMFIKDPLHPKFNNSWIAFTDFQDTMLALAGREADAGAKIISFSEALMFTVKPVEEMLIKKGQKLAKEKNITLLMCVGSFLPGEVKRGSKYIENKAILIDSTGKVAFTFFKNKPVPIVEGSIAGDGSIPIASTPFGLISASICYDADFPQLIRQAGVQGSDILLLPAGDWKEISPYHSDMARMRAIENGFSILRPVSGATSIASDPYGRVVSSRSFYGSGEKVVVAYLPVKGVTTFYARMGDYFVWLCVALILVTCSFKITRRSSSEMGQIGTESECNVVA